MSSIEQWPKTAVNLSMLFSELPLGERPEAARRLGFNFVESWWHFEGAAAKESEIVAYCESFSQAGVQLVLQNLTAGPVAASDRGILTDPGANTILEQNLDSVCEILSRTGCGIVNALYGNRINAADTEVEDALALERIIRIADRIGQFGATVVIETLNAVSSPLYPLTNIDRTAEVVTEARSRSKLGNIALLLDTYHLTTMGTDPVAAIRRHGPLLGHVQFADAPGRGRPGTGEIHFDRVLGALGEVGYTGFVGLEYDPLYLTLTSGVEVHTKEMQ